MVIPGAHEKLNTTQKHNALYKREFAFCKFDLTLTRLTED